MSVIAQKASVAYGAPVSLRPLFAILIAVAMLFAPLALQTGAAMAMYTTAAGGATFLGSAVVAIVRPLGGNVAVVWAFVLLYACAFAMTYFLKVHQPRLHGPVLKSADEAA